MSLTDEAGNLEVFMPHTTAPAFKPKDPYQILGTGGENKQELDPQDTVVINGQIIYWPGASDCFEDLQEGLQLGLNSFTCHGQVAQLSNDKLVSPLFSKKEQLTAYRQLLAKIADKPVFESDRMLQDVGVLFSLLDRGFNKEARQLADQIAIRDQQMEPDDFTTALVNFDLAIAYDRMNNPKQAQEHFVRAQTATSELIFDDYFFFLTSKMWQTLMTVRLPADFRRETLSGLEWILPHIDNPTSRAAFLSRLGQFHPDKEQALNYFRQSFELLQNSGLMANRRSFLELLDAMANASADIENETFEVSQSLLGIFFPLDGGDQETENLKYYFVQELHSAPLPPESKALLYKRILDYENFMTHDLPGQNTSTRVADYVRGFMEEGD